MLVSYKWLQEYVDLSELKASEIAEKMTRGGIEIDFIHELNKGVSGIVVGYVQECKQHPNADKLNVCKVDIGEEIVQIVCGAPNVAAGQHVIVAKVGAVLPGNFKIKKAKLRGEVSMGMICSLQELGIDSKLVQKEYAEGIYTFSDEVPVGSDALPHLNLDDHVLELDLTPNRSDCLNMLGVAYEVSSLYSLPIQLPQVQLDVKEVQNKSEHVSVQIEDEVANPYYGAIVIKDVQVAPSPLWLQNRLMAAGIRPISNVVDVTNYVLLEYGQPLHAFDYERFGSTSVVTRKAKKGETMLSLDGVERTLTEDHLVITNGEEPMAIAGVMGGEKSEVQEDTKNILLEAAYFDPSNIRKTSRELGLRSDSSARFEKGVDVKRTRAAAKRAAELIQQLAGGEIANELVEVDHLIIEEPSIQLELNELNKRLGLMVTQAEVVNIFKQLRFEFELHGDTFIVTGPTRRQDIQIAEDLYEEVARIYGYDNIPTTLPEGATIQGHLTDYQIKRRKVRRYLQGAGLNEVLTYSLTSPEKAKGFAMDVPMHQVRLAMPMSEERSTMRTSLIPHLFDVIRYNLNRKNDQVAVFEIGSVFNTDEQVLSKQPTEQEMIAFAITGLWEEHSWQGEKKAVDFYVLKGIVEGLLTELGLAGSLTFSQGTKPGMHPGRTAILALNGQEIGYVGQVHPQTEKDEDLKATYLGQLDLLHLLSIAVESVTYEQLPRFPAMVRDIALVVNKEVPAGQLEQTIISTGGELLKSVRLFDLYEGEHLEEGKKSLAFSLTYLDPERTLTDEEVTNQHEQVLAALAEQGATLRS
ncbi:phenylalanine--tRNA ligase subunit beta [Alkalihalobacillus pseudalcaliphilus]|uniref:phenylalanine--tRNA ligase subunit beta n=1 Tax=Alkalihalobacillus pseudalcaliphilus TaxID=79884 RepID=UPI00064DE5A9|nr:phenylalanine--tRNA ligase subunit beta [Alkalihalobacillus pseudalcaliphilus]KMK74591.1 phenylalanyl-tRNA synthase subunit beta [Alkalihalobacillus pseudalcaliphilus]